MASGNKLHRFGQNKAYETANKALEAARELGLGPEEFRLAHSSQWEAILRQIFQKFANTQNRDVTWLWEHLKHPGAHIQIDDALTRIFSMVESKTEVWVLLEDWDGTKKFGNYWVFEGQYGAALKVLGNMHGLEYYIVEHALSWMLLENHHNFLVGIGEPAQSFIEELKKTQ